VISIVAILISIAALIVSIVALVSKRGEMRPTSSVTSAMAAPTRLTQIEDEDDPTMMKKKAL